MQVPEKIPGLRLGTVLMVAYAAAWISLEGAPWRAVVMGFLVTAVSTTHLVQRLVAGRSLTFMKWLAFTSATGLLLGLGSGGLTLLFMAIKTGLHAHGPEFTAAEILWVIERIPLWSGAGLLGGLGVGLVTGKK